MDKDDPSTTNLFVPYDDIDKFYIDYTSRRDGEATVYVEKGVRQDGGVVPTE